MGRSFSGNFHLEVVDGHHWRLLRTSAPRAEIDVMGDSAPPEIPHGHCTVNIDWDGDAAVLTIESPGDGRRCRARSAFIHEPLPNLYDALPLARFDARARRFWRWVFLLVRLPGGRRLLGMLARRA
jgi:hypothetical protein